MSPALSVGLQRLLPQRLLCALIYRVARARTPLIKTPLIHWFARRFRVDLDEAERSRLGDYASLNDFFSRALKPGLRPVDADPRRAVAPVDGQLTEFGTIDDGRLLQAKGVDYAVTELLAETSADSAPFRNGRFATIYLAPHNYHRIHAPLAGRWTRTRYVPGARFSVNRGTTLALKNLFCRNERAVCWFETGLGPMVVVLVGALNVSSISTTPLGEIPSGRAAHWRHEPALPVEKGAEIGRFNLGSTVIVLFPNATVEWLDTLAPGQTLAMGRPIAELRPAS